MTNPLVSIIIPTFNLVNYLTKCIESIKKNTSIAHEIIVVDNGSHDNTLHYLQTVPDVQVIANQYNLAFAKACNQGFRTSVGKYIMFLNNDTLVTPGWLEPLVNCLKEDKTVGVAGSKLLYPFTNIVQHAGVCFIRQNGLIAPSHIYYRHRDGYAGVNKKRTFKAVTGACMLIHRDIFAQIGGFDENYINSFEDVDLCLRIGEAGFKILYCPESLVYHYESVSEGRNDNIDISWDGFYRKWQRKLSIDYLKYYEEDRAGEFPAVSIIMETLNELDYTRHCLDKILKTVHPPFETIVVDKGSTDGTIEYLAQCDQLKYVFADVNLESIMISNHATKYALGNKIVLLKRDMVIEPYWVEKLLAQPNNPNLIRR